MEKNTMIELTKEDSVLFLDFNAQKLFFLTRFLPYTYVSDSWKIIEKSPVPEVPFVVQTQTLSGTPFYLPILESGWIYNVCLVTDGHIIPATHLVRACLYYNKEKIYSIFYAEYPYLKPAEKMEAHWRYMVNENFRQILYETASIFFEVKAQEEI